MSSRGVISSRQYLSPLLCYCAASSVVSALLPTLRGAPSRTRYNKATTRFYRQAQVRRLTTATTSRLSTLHDGWSSNRHIQAVPWGSRKCQRAMGSKVDGGGPPGYIKIYNEQEDLDGINVEKLKETMSKIRKWIGYDTYDVELFLVGDEDMQDTNQRTRGIDAPTDILSFPDFNPVEPGILEEPEFDFPHYYNLGEMLIDIPYVMRKCDEAAAAAQKSNSNDTIWEYDTRGVAPAMEPVLDPEKRLHMLLVHGMLHLVGYDHEEDDEYELMVQKEDELLAHLGLAQAPPTSRSLNLDLSKEDGVAISPFFQSHWENGTVMWDADNDNDEQTVNTTHSPGFFNDSDRAAHVRELVKKRRFSEVDTFLESAESSIDDRPGAGSASSFVHTAAISAMSKLPNSHQRVFALFQRMEEKALRPTPFVFSALFQSIPKNSGALERVMELRSYLLEKYPGIRWTIPVYEAAILACSGCSENSKAVREHAWLTSQQIRQWMEHENIAPTYRIYLALLKVCASIQNVEATLLLKNEMVKDENIRMDSKLWGIVLQILASIGSSSDTLDILMQMQNEFDFTPNVKHCTLHLKALSIAGHDEKAVHFLEKMAGLHSKDTQPVLGKISAPDQVSVLTALKACATTENFTLASHVLQLVKQRSLGKNVPPNEQMYNLVLRACADPIEAMGLIREMRLTRRKRVGVVPPSLLSYTRAMVVCRKAKNLSVALSLLQQSRHDGIDPDTFLYSSVIWTAAAVGDCDRGYALMEEMKQNGCEPTVVTYNGLIAALASARRVEEAVMIFEELKEEGLVGTWVTYSHLARAFRNALENSTDRIALLERIFDLLERDERTSYVGSPIISLLISAYGALGNYGEARRVFDSLEGPSDAGCLRAILFACGNASPPQWEEALGLLHSSDIVGETIGPTHVDAIAVSNAMVACAKADEWEEALGLLRLYGGDRTSIVAFNSLIAACGRSGRPDMAVEVLNDMDVFGVSPDTVSYRNAIIACNQAQHAHSLNVTTATVSLFEWWECSLSLLRRMQENDLHPDIQTYSSVISACESAGEWQRALGILQSVLDDSTGGGPTANLYCFNAAISACEKGGAWVEALELYERMKAHPSKSVKPNSITLGSLILALDKANQKELSQDIFREGLRRRILNPWRTTLDQAGTEIRAMDLHHYSAALARASVRNHLESLLEKGSAARVSNDFVVIVGKGLRSVHEPVLLKTVTALLEDDYGLDIQAEEDNKGRLVIPSEKLRDLVSRKSWR